MKIDPVWPREKEDYLRQWYGKLTAAQIAQNISRMTNTYVSKNAVIGKATRMGLQKKERSPLGPKRNYVTHAQPQVEPFTCRMVSLEDIKGKQCRFPIEGTELYCGNDGMSHQRPFCIEHWNRMKRK